MAIFLSEDDVRRILTMPMAMESVEYAHQSLALGGSDTTVRQRSRQPQTVLHILQGALPGKDIVGYKAYTSNRQANRFFIHLFDVKTGEAMAVLSADYLGMMRTAAASGIATHYLARKDAVVAGVFGAGWQAEGHVTALAEARPLKKIKVYSRRREPQLAFCQRMSARLNLEVVPADSAEQTLRGSDIVSTITTAKDPVFDGEWLESGTHINAAGSNALIRREIDEKTVSRATQIIVDTRDTALAEAGDLLPALEKGRLHARQLIELGDIITGVRQGRTGEKDITLFESQGVAVQDLAVAARVFQAARTMGLGTQLPY